jgi:acyl carrier protein
VEERVKVVMAQVLGLSPEEICESSSPETIDQWDSLKHMQLIMALEDEFDVQFSDEAIPEMTRYDLITERTKDLLS